MSVETEEWESMSDLLANALKRLMAQATYYGHTPCCGQHYRGSISEDTANNKTHKDSCFALNTLVVYKMKKELQGLP